MKQITKKTIKSIWPALALAALWCTALAAAAGDPVLYPAPSGALMNTSFTVQIRKEGGTWQNLAVYTEEVNPGYEQLTAFVYFSADFSSRIEVRVTDKLHRAVSSARIRPWSYNIAFTQEDTNKTVRFFLDRPRKIVVEFNKDTFHNVQVFANPAEVNPPTSGASGVTYFGPGLHTPGQINLSSNQTVYIAGGALVRGYIRASNASNITIRGRGVLDGSTHGQRIIVPTNCSNVTIEGIILTDARSWTIVPTSSDHVTITNIKEICRYGYGDGIDVVSCQNLTIDDVYLRNGDDNISIKASGSESNSDILIKNSVFFCDNAHPILIGPEGNGTYTQRVTYQNNDILQSTMSIPYGGALAVCSGDNMTLRDITFQDVRIDTFSQTPSSIANIFIEDNEYTSSPGKSISNVTFRNISCNLSRYDSIRIVGYDATRTVNGVLFEDLVINGQTIRSTTDTPFSINAFSSNIRFASTTGIAAPAPRTRLASAPPAVTAIHLGAPAADRPARIVIFNALGQAVRTGLAQPTDEIFAWDGKDYGGCRVKPGVYFYTVEGGRQLAGKVAVW